MAGHFIERATLDTLVQAALDHKTPVQSGLLVLLAERGAPDLHGLVAALRPVVPAFFGGVFPAVIHGSQRFDCGAVIESVPLLHAPILFSDLQAGSVPAELGLISPPEGARPTAVVFVDGLSPQVAGWLRAVYARLGTTVTYLGGGAGSLTFEPRPCLFTQDGVSTSGAVLALSSLACTVGVRHGWTRLGGPLVATRTTRNRLHELNWRPAGEVYQEALGPIGEGRFFEVAKGHPFGIRKEGQEDVIRDPIAIEPDGTLVCVGEVPQNAVLHIMEGHPSSLVAAAGQAAREARQAGDATHRVSLVMDCISRAIFLEDRFVEELAVLGDGLGSNPLAVPLGALTLGEIASPGDSLLEWFNKTAVVGALHARD